MGVFSCSGGRGAEVFIHLLWKCLVESGRGVTSSITASGVTLQGCTSALASRPSTGGGGEAGREEPQIEVDAGSCKVGTLKVREIHMRHCCSTSDKVIMTGVPAQILLNASWPPWASLVAQW